MAVVQVQKGAPMPLLIGTNLQPQLGVLFLQCTTGVAPQKPLQTKALSNVHVHVHVHVYPLRVLTTASYTLLPLMMECMSHTLHRQWQRNV